MKIKVEIENDHDSIDPSGSKEIFTLLNNTIHSIEYKNNEELYSSREFKDSTEALKNLIDDIVDRYSSYCPTCQSCGEEFCCPPTKCKFGVQYIQNLYKHINELEQDLIAAKKTVKVYLDKQGYKVYNNTVDQEIKFWGKQ